MSSDRSLRLGTLVEPDVLPDTPPTPPSPFAIPADHLSTHAVIVGATGCGKSGLLLVLAEEALRQGIPVLLFDVKGDLPNLALAFDTFDAAPFVPWIDPADAARLSSTPEELAARLADRRREGLEASGLTESHLHTFREATDVRILTPGARYGEPVHLLSALELRSPAWDTDPDQARASLGAAVSMVLRLAGHDADPAKPAHVLLCVLAERRHRAHLACGLGALVDDLETPPVPAIGALAIDDFVPPRKRMELAAALNALHVSPTLGPWRSGAPLDVGAWLTPRQPGRTPAVIVSVAHLSDEERTPVLALILEEVLAWVRTQPGTGSLRALVAFDEMYGFLPPHPGSPPTKRPLVSLVKQARAYGVGLVLATQNPMDLDYRALSNAGVWLVGRLATDADRERVVEALAGSGGGRSGSTTRAHVESRVRSLPPRQWLVRDAHVGSGLLELRTRHTLCWLRGPMTEGEVRRVVGG